MIPLARGDKPLPVHEGVRWVQCAVLVAARGVGSSEQPSHVSVYVKGRGDTEVSCGDVAQSGRAADLIDLRRSLHLCHVLRSASLISSPVSCTQSA